MSTTLSNIIEWAMHKIHILWVSKTGGLWIVLIEKLNRSCVYYPMIIWGLTFTAVMTIILSLGFGPNGIVAGSCAAVLQSVVYGAFTPAASLFAILTGLGMVGTLAPYAALFSGLVASAAAFSASRYWTC